MSNSLNPSLSSVFILYVILGCKNIKSDIPIQKTCDVLNTAVFITTVDFNGHMEILFANYICIVSKLGLTIRIVNTENKIHIYFY